MRAIARRLGMLEAPREDRWHRTPTALLGGLAIYGAFLTGFVLHFHELAAALPVMISSTLLLMVGLLDDCVGVSPRAKITAQILAAAIVVNSGLHLPWTQNAAMNGLLTVVWLVGIANAINLLDNMDGLAAGVSAIACVFLAATFSLNGQTEFALFPALLCGATLGFLVFNFKPASIFMGDCGSMFLGSALGGIALLSEYGRSRNLLAVLLTPVLIMAIPIFDTCLVTVTRKLAGQPVSRGGRDHVSHRLVALGVSERWAVLILYALAASCGLFALLLRRLTGDQIECSGRVAWLQWEG